MMKMLMMMMITMMTEQFPEIRRDKGPPSMVPLAPGALPRLERVNDTESDYSDGDAGEKDAKRQKLGLLLVSGQLL